MMTSYMGGRWGGAFSWAWQNDWGGSRSVHIPTPELGTEITEIKNFIREWQGRGSDDVIKIFKIVGCF